jgi:hypothetical protein
LNCCLLIVLPYFIINFRRNRMSEQQEERVEEEEIELEVANGDNDIPAPSGEFISSVSLLDLIEQKKFKEFHDKINLPGDLDDTDDLTVLVQNGSSDNLHGCGDIACNPTTWCV